MVLRNVELVRVKDLDASQKEDLKITATSGLVAIETHNSTFHRKAVQVKGLLSYIMEGGN